MTVVYNGVDLERFKLEKRPKLNHGKLELLYLGRVAPVKGIHVLISALPSIAALIPGVRLTVAGGVSPANEGYLEDLRRMAASGGCNVDFIGHVDNIATLIHASDIVVAPSVWEEAFGRVLLEAMACGVPVVASNVGGMPEVLGPSFGTHLFKPNDAEALATVVSTVHGKLQGDQSLSERCRNRAEQFAIENTVLQVEKILESTVYEHELVH